MAKVRTFICIPLPDKIIRQIERVQEKIRQQDDGTRWVNPKTMHLTLQFLGDIDETSVDEISRLISPLIASTPAFTLSLDRVGAFPNLRQPKVFWIGVQDAGGQLFKLQDEIATQLLKLGFKEDKKYHPHLTLGRVKKPWLAKKVAEKLLPLEWNFGSFDADTVSAMKSELLPQGAHHTPLIEIELPKN
jgi:RNA 2',3'-cyclic 3'-phosphodiesterase